MRSLAFAVILLLTDAAAAQAGAWLREEGKGFASFSVQTNEDGDSSTSVYAEYGLTRDVTLGTDITYDTDLLDFVGGADLAPESLSDMPQGDGIVFLRMALGPTDRTHKWAYHIGLGARYLDARFLEAAEVGLSWGRGIQWGDRYGWVNIDGSHNIARSPAEARSKLDATIGLGLTDRTKVMLQVFNTFVSGERFTKLSPSLLYASKTGTTTFQLASEIPIDGGAPALKIGIWYDF